MDNILLEAFLLALMVGAGGTAIGAGSALLIRHPGRRLSCVLLGLAGGLMLAVALLDMLPEAWEEGGFWPLLIGLILGFALLLFLSRRTHHEHLHDADGVDPGLVQEHQLARTGLLIALGMSIHNVPQGLAIGTGIAAGFAWPLSVLLMLHNVPEGMAMALPLKVGRASAVRIMGIALLTAVPTIVGALIGALLSEISGAFVGGCLAFSAGSMIFITISELIPQAVNLGSRTALILSAAAGALLGGLFVWLLG
ncbi:MAG: ZIP family metal transporter [Clostridia bacterium]|nr:ZIP family metal transporter [Clostridia bacterium]